jgi:hypothetical protein
MRRPRPTVGSGARATAIGQHLCQGSRQRSGANHGVWPMDFSNNKNGLKKSINITIQLTFYLILLTSISWLPSTSVLKSQLPWSTWPWWGIFYQIQERSYKTITIYRDKII